MKSMNDKGSMISACIDDNRAFKALYIVCEVLIRLGYFVNITKSVFIPCRIIKFLGMLVDSLRLAFVLPAYKIQKFSALREGILAEDSVDLFTLQKFAGKCSSFILAVPSAKLYTKEVNRAISQASKNSGVISISSDLRKEIGDTVGHFWTIGQIVSRGGMKNIYKYLCVRFFNI